MWSAMRCDLTNLVPGDIDQFAVLGHARLRFMRYRLEPFEGCLAGAGLPLET